jgi:hypothetical protein
MSPAEIGAAMGKSTKVIKSRLKLLKLPRELQEKVHLGKVGVERALKHLDPKDEPKDKAPTLRDLQRYYSSPPDELTDDIRPLITEEVRKLLAFWLGVKYQPRRQEQPA